MVRTWDCIAHEVFISHSSLDKPVADLFAWHLKKRDPLLQILREVQVVANSDLLRLSWVYLISGVSEIGRAHV